MMALKSEEQWEVLNKESFADDNAHHYVTESGLSTDPPVRAKPATLAGLLSGKTSTRALKVQHNTNPTILAPRLQENGVADNIIQAHQVQTTTHKNRTETEATKQPAVTLNALLSGDASKHDIQVEEPPKYISSRIEHVRRGTGELIVKGKAHTCRTLFDIGADVNIITTGFVGRMDPGDLNTRRPHEKSIATISSLLPGGIHVPLEFWICTAFRCHDIPEQELEEVTFYLLDIKDPIVILSWEYIARHGILDLMSNKLSEISTLHGPNSDEEVPEPCGRGIELNALKIKHSEKGQKQKERHDTESREENRRVEERVRELSRQSQTGSSHGTQAHRAKLQGNQQPNPRQGGYSNKQPYTNPYFPVPQQGGYSNAARHPNAHSHPHSAITRTSTASSASTGFSVDSGWSNHTAGTIFTEPDQLDDEPWNQDHKDSHDNDEYEMVELDDYHGYEQWRNDRTF